MGQKRQKSGLLAWSVPIVITVIFSMLSTTSYVAASSGSIYSTSQKEGLSKPEFTIPQNVYNFNDAYFPTSDPLGLILYDQFGPFSPTLAISQNYDDMHNSLDTEVADDFVVPAGDGIWEVDSIDVIGACHKDNIVFDCGTLDSANVRIYAGGSIVPGNLIYSASYQTVETADSLYSPLRQYVVRLSTPAFLTPGPYWISIQVNMDYATGDWGWLENNNQSGNWHVFRNPGGGWHEGCYDWCSGHRTWPDLNFRINGNFGGNYKEAISVGAPVYDVVEHGQQPLVYASAPEKNSVLVINTDSGNIQATIPVVSPRALAISPDNSTVFVATANSIAVISTTTNTVVNSFPLGYYSFPKGVILGSAGYLYTNVGADITVRNPSTGNYIGSLPYNLHLVSRLVVSPDGDFLCSVAAWSPTSTMSCFDISMGIPSGPLATNLNVCDNVKNIDISSDGKFVYVVCGSPSLVKVFTMDTLTEFNQFSIGTFPSSLMDSPDGKVLFGSSEDGAWLFDPDSQMPFRLLDHAEITFLKTGRDNHTGYAADTTEYMGWGNLVIYHFGEFRDTSWKYYARPWIERLYSAGITGGCSPLMYCPEASVTRAQMAVFLLRGMHGASYSPPAVEASTGFNDVPVDYWAAPWIKQLAVEGITGGCGNGNYCPENPVTRAQMAVFLLRAKYTSAYTPPPAAGGFTDVPLDYWSVDWIEQLANEGITSGCGANTYCPNKNVTRGQMAVFLVRTFNLP